MENSITYRVGSGDLDFSEYRPAVVSSEIMLTYYMAGILIDSVTFTTFVQLLRRLQLP